MTVLTAGAGTGGPAAALSLPAAGAGAAVAGSAREPRPLGVRSGPLPHAVREPIEPGHAPGR
ncbi:2-polyprenyl-6-methoxyphenol hydroxylase-like FAD-dependent oxidoreductase [Streptomyces demainii]|uniref:2-polyprenyl-6-methoxyphenol hydroxylase-like FAD-dependent oxidoreductase n=1 Tax=Streptomyces demainii TaxID=588122 RepID=A0ABT9KXG8_9ACTN|nr:2-polyprenyl-6-methoxyphenol hydroxylase-like FAD-dependent oxidoreductase [Streptomyces demainii]